MSRRTTMCIVNCSGKNITSIQATVKDQSGFEDPAKFKTWLETDGTSPRTIGVNDSLCGYVELSDAGPSKYSLTGSCWRSFEKNSSSSLQQHGVAKR